jgi:flavin reductase (DIM6/NTAB) family NADH-FMN oxidoreductase RutF
MQLDLSQLPPRDAYQWLIGLILPRPIAWVSTVGPSGSTNLAPFSFFQGVTSSPPTLMFVPVNDRSGRKKDTLRNIEQIPEFVVHLVSHAQAETMNRTSALLPYGESEIDAFSIETVPAQRVRPPRLARAAVAFECALHQIVPIGDGPLAANVVFGRILLTHVHDDVLGPDGRPDVRKLDLVGRLGGDEYASTRDRFSLPRPDR